MITPKTPMVNKNQEHESPDYLVANTKVSPVNIVSAGLIMSLDKVSDEVIVPEYKVERIVIANKSDHFINKFFLGRMSSYLDSIQSFLTKLESGYKRHIEQSKAIFERERIETLLRQQKYVGLIEDKEESLKNKDKNKKSKASNLLQDLINITAAVFTQAVVGLVADPGGGSVKPTEAGATLAGDDKLAGLTGTSGSVAYEGKTGTDLAVSYSPFAQTDVDAQGIVITSGKGYRQSTSSDHKGYDVGADFGTPMYAYLDGEVTHVNTQLGGPADSGYGYWIVWKDSVHGAYHFFGHLDRPPGLKVGNKFKAGALLANVGGSGSGSLTSYAPHLHWEISVDPPASNGQFQTYMDPGEWINTHGAAPKPKTGPAAPNYGKSEGAIQLLGQILVGEAGTEFVIPISQMPQFMQLMIDEKIKTLIPLYMPPKDRFPDIGFERLSGFSNNSFGSGGVAAAIPFVKKHEALGAFVPGTGGGNRLADYIGEGMSESIKGTPRSKAYKPSTKLFSYVDTEGVDTIGYGTTFYDNIFTGSMPVRSRDTSTVGEMESTMNRHLEQIDEKYDEEYPMYKHLKPQQQAGIISYLYNRGPNAILFHGPSDRALSSGNIRALADLIQEDTASVCPKRRKEEADLIRSGSLQVVGPGKVGPGIVGPGKVGTGIPFLPDLTIQKMFQSFGNQSSLNNIPGEQQMEVAKEYSKDFEDTSSEKILMLYKPRVLYRSVG